ncbi:hypothetical protein [Phaeobacter gallaeciensis]|uniref:Uncharacterized protein n=1 Tax=Phaeobacter gallaeciensis TaxID=60890 RepID=A0AAC9ZA53_9RHOB|nr:hypothetical protein [Phaeobacter gallaeciensis]AHD10151.1 hypothetical protein Gal_02406 [Phaeobacter gallaeciensis DSM 26640]ATE93415.1 hypothetical protein PhaeoP11_02397 [Phaeobacter gallaeciensis]ATE96764.1 hypothetical protein PhaeoP73_01450 [Phaeobacter gallaeciensis]ATF02079.1 hypothetical protein PhaeoP75_02446 [Phaeobacter gallaeciensis]ATF06459.1 hypothetical protein PhaeoP63_02395 [Phaeobacter gallaeciensis]
MKEDLLNEFEASVQAMIEGELSVRKLTALHAYKFVFDDDLYDIFDDCATKLPNARATGSKYNYLEMLLGIADAQRIRNRTNNVSHDVLQTFELNSDDKSKLLALCSEMRELNNSTLELDDKTKNRIAKRITAIEAQVRSGLGILDVVLSGMAEVGEAAGKFGSDVKPLVDRMREVAQIARSGSNDQDALPPPEEVKKLPRPEGKEES